MEWLLARPEMRDFLGGRTMVPYEEPWMDRVDTMKTLQGWTDVTVTHFRDLGVYGEQILLSIRYGDWIDVNDEDAAKNWAAKAHALLANDPGMQAARLTRLAALAEGKSP